MGANIIVFYGQRTCQNKCRKEYVYLCSTNFKEHRSNTAIFRAQKRSKRVLGSKIGAHFMVPGDSEHDDNSHRKSSNFLRNFAKISCVAQQLSMVQMRKWITSHMLCGG